MTIVAPFSRFKKSNFRLYIAFCLGFALWCAYDGYCNKNWIKQHTNSDGTPTTYLVFNRKAPMYLVGAAVLLGAYLLAIRNKQILSDEKKLVISGKEEISYDSIEKIDKTNFKSKGYFIITYKDAGGREINRKLSDRTYDNLQEILDELVARISETK